MEDPTDPMEAAALPVRIASKIRVDQETGCWIWTFSRFANGYGRAYFKGNTRLAHRVIYELMVGPIPDALTIDHLCGVKLCCRPSHLEAVTMAENTRRAGIARRRPACPKGHQLPQDGKPCRDCRRQRDRERLADPEVRQRRREYDRYRRVPRNTPTGRRGQPGPDQQRIC